jgi:hypothetical protein
LRDSSCRMLPSTGMPDGTRQRGHFLLLLFLLILLLILLYYYYYYYCYYYYYYYYYNRHTAPAPPQPSDAPQYIKTLDSTAIESKLQLSTQHSKNISRC